jgi:hypothetical protein
MSAFGAHSVVNVLPLTKTIVTSFPMKGEESYIFQLQLSRSGHRLAASDSLGGIGVYDTETMERLLLVILISQSHFFIFHSFLISLFQCLQTL